MTWSATLKKSASDGLGVSDPAIIKARPQPEERHPTNRSSGCYGYANVCFYLFCLFPHLDGKDFWLNQNPKKHKGRLICLGLPTSSASTKALIRHLQTPLFSRLWGAGSMSRGGDSLPFGEPTSDGYLKCQASLSIVPGYAVLRWMSVFGSDLNSLTGKPGPGKLRPFYPGSSWAQARLETGLELQGRRVVGLTGACL